MFMLILRGQLFSFVPVSKYNLRFQYPLLLLKYLYLFCCVDFGVKWTLIQQITKKIHFILESLSCPVLI